MNEIKKYSNMKRINIISRAMAAIILVTTLGMVACSSETLPTTTDTTAASGGDHPGVVLQLTAPTVTVANLSASAQSREATSTNYLSGQLYVDLIDSNGNQLQSKGRFSYGFNGSTDGKWKKDEDYDKNLYVTGGTGTYRARAYGYVDSSTYGTVEVAYIGTIIVSDNSDGTGTFSLNLKPVAAAIKVKLVADNGAELDDKSSYFGCDFVGIDLCKDIELKDGITELNDTEGVRYFNAISHTGFTAQGATDFASGQVVPGSYPAKWKGDGYTDVNNGSDKDLGSEDVLLTIYKSDESFALDKGKPVDTDFSTPISSDKYTAYTVKATKGSIEFTAGKLTTLTIKLGSKDATVTNVTVSDLTDGGTIIGTYGDEVRTTMAQLATMTPAQIAALPTKWVVTGTDEDINLNWNNKNYNGTACALLVDMIKSFNTSNSKCVDLVLPKATTLSSFTYNAGLKSIYAPTLEKSITDYQFANCTNLETVNFPKVTSIGDGAFSGCTKLTYVNLCGGITSWGSNVFGYESGNTTNKINLTLCKDQKMTTNEGAGTAATFGETTMTADDAGENKPFAGYIFKSITLK